MNNHTDRTENKARIGRRILLLLAAVITAIAVAVTCALTVDTSKRVSVDAVDSAEVSTSTVYSNLTSTTISTYIANGTFNNGDYIDYTYNGSYRSVTLPRGTWRFEVWGAQGGWSGNSGANTGTANGGLGGYAKGEITITAATTYYIYCGGTGSGGEGSIDGTNYTVRPGGYNGGGQGAGRAGSGGGGGTDIRTDTGTDKRIIVAGGGGGGPDTSITQTHVHSTENKVFYGGNGCTTKHATSSSWTNDEGGGGGGYYGGDARHGDDPKSSYCGSNYISDSFTNTSNSYGHSNAKGNGKARITAVTINSAPVSQDYDIPTVKARGTNLGISVAASSLAKDNDYANISGGSATNVYFSAGTSGDYDAAPANNSGVYLDAACTKDAYANGYLEYSWSGGTATTRNTLTISAIKKLPRNNVDGQADNKFTLYTKVRDNWGATKNRGVGVAKFTLSVTNNNLTVNGAKYVDGKYKFGSANFSTAGSNNFLASYSDGKILNPAGTGKTTLFIPKPFSPTDTTGITINASEIFSDADTNYDKVAFKSISVFSNYSGYVNASSYYNVALNSNTNYATGLYPSFTIKPTGVRPAGSPYVVMQITAQSSETASKAAVGNTVNTVYLVFQVANTRPYFGSTNALATNLRKAEPSVSVAVGGTQRINLKNFLYDIDDGATLRATFAQGAADLKVPTNEYIQVDANNLAVPLATNVGSNYAGKTSVATNSKTTAEGTTATYFKTNSIAAHGSNAAANANVTYRYIDSQTIEFIGRTATQNQYRKENGTMLDSTRKGHFYVLVRVVDPFDTSDAGIWFPIAIEVTSQTPTEPATFANVTLGFTGFNAGTDTAAATKGDAETGLLTPIGYLNDEGTLTGVGTQSSDGNSRAAVPFVLDRDAVMFSSNGITALNDFAVIDTSSGNPILDNDSETANANDTSSFFKVELVYLYARKSDFAMIPDGELSNYGINIADSNVTFSGLKITPIRSTNGEYYQFRVKVKDTHGKPGVISVCVKVENRALSLRLDPTNSETPDGYKINALSAKDAGITPYGEYKQNDSLGAKVVNYTVEVGDQVQITPYDFAYDFDIDPSTNLINKGTFNSNPADDGFAAVATGILKEYSIAHTAEPATSSTQKTPSAVKAQRLDFANRASIAAYNAQYSNYVNLSVGDYSYSGGTGYNIPAITITGVSRTTSAIIQLRLTITDGFESVECCIITITVLNSAPTLNPRLNDYYNLTAQTDTTSTITPNVRVFTADEISYDKDGDAPTFDANEVRIVAKDGNNYYSHLVYNQTQKKYQGCSENTANAIALSDYVSAVVTKGSGGVDVIRIQGLSSTELFNLPVYVEFLMRDGYRAQPQQATLYLLVNVVNTAPIFVGDGLLKTEADAQTNEQYTWLIGYEVNSEIMQKRYLFNSRELYNGSLISNTNSPITIPANNKVYLFDDYDAQQHVILNPSKVETDPHDYRTNIVATYDNRVYDTNGAIAGAREISQSDFESSQYENAAVLYTPMYESSGTDTPFNDGYVSVNVKYFSKVVEENGVKFQELPGGADVSTCEYWAIEIEDRHTTGSRRPIQFALSVKDSHHGKTLYKAPDKLELNTSANQSERKVLNFYYNYRQPGILAMHTYYRTDGNAESKVYVNGEDDSQGYLVDYRDITSKEFDPSETDYIDEYDDTATTAARKQEILGLVKFKDEFKYRYFERTYTVTDASNVSTTHLTYKHYPAAESKFAYNPIRIADGMDNGAVYVPMSYIALPKGASEITEGNTHVTFANAGSGDTLSGGNKLLDKNYATWQNSNATLALVYSNMSLSDGTNTYPVDNNPYLTIEYIAKTGNGTLNFSDEYKNTQRMTLSGPGNKTYTDQTIINYREDKYGFRIAKKEGGIRAPGMLKLTLALKTIDANTESAVEMVEVEIKLNDFNPSVKYYSFIEDKENVATTTKFVETSVSMTIGNTANSTVTLTSPAPTQATNGDFGKIFYTDPDTSDSMKFYLPSTFEGGLTTAEINHLLGLDADGNMNGDSAPIVNYYGVTTVNQVGSGGLVDPYNYNPNPNYSTFFDVSPANGSSDSLQFIPKAKTQPNFPEGTSDATKDAYYDKYHLEEDDDGKVYYPFRVLFYDEYKGSAFTDGVCYAATIRVYIDNDKITVNKAAVGNETYSSSSTNVPAIFKGAPKYKVSLSTNSVFYVDVTSLLKDEDIVLTQGLFATKKDTAWTTLNTEESYRRDYLDMPTATGYEDLTRAAYPNTSETLPFTIGVGGSEDYRSLPNTTLVFKANCAFKSTRDLGFTFRDSNGTAAQIVFSLEYSNNAPTPNRATFGVSNSINVTMRTGDTFYLYASDSTEFEKDKDGGFTSYKTLVTDNRYTFPYSSTERPAEQNAEQMYSNFKFFSDWDGNNGSNGSSEHPTGDSLVLASDDAPTTLRIVSVDLPSSSLLTYKKELPVARENDGQQGHLRLAVTAKGVINTEIAITLADHAGISVVVYVRVNVLSTAPTAKTTGLPSGVTRVEENVYAISLKYNELGLKAPESANAFKKISLKQLMNDIDADDVNSLDVYSNMGGSQFSITNPGESAVIAASIEKISDINHVVISATDFINKQSNGECATVSFRVADKHGAVSETITIRVTIAPAEVTTVVASGRALPVNIMSYAEYIDVENNAGEPIEVKLIQNDGADLFKDTDVNAPSASYAVEVYVLLEQSASGNTMNYKAYDPTSTGNNILLYGRYGAEEQFNTTAPEVQYVEKFFTISASEDGKSLLFAPNAATIRSGSSISNIPLYVVVRKRYDDSTMAGKGAEVNVTVGNSKLMATQNTTRNMGYPTVNGSEDDDLRESEFLSFTGSKGDSLTWKMYDLERSYLGLFYDYDMINLPTINGGREIIKYVGYSYRVANESGNTTNDPVLDISCKGEGDKQELTIRINRNVTTGQPPANGLDNRPTAIDVYIYAVDAVNNTAGITINDTNKVVATKIVVNVENDRPEFAVTGRVSRCPYCGKTDTVRQTSPRLAQCNDCNKSFKSLDPDQLGYTLSHDADNGYVMNLTLENTKSCNVNIADIIDDADIDMDAYVMLNTGSENSLMGISGTPAANVRAGDENAFGVTYQSATNKYKVSTLSYLTFTCRSTTRGAVAVCNVKFRDSYIGSETSVLTIRLTVGNTAPTKKTNVKTDITVVGISENATDEQVAAAYKQFNILDFITDINGDNFDPATDVNRRPTYTYIDEIVVYSRTDDTISNRPTMFGPNLIGETINEETGETETYISVDSACMVNWMDGDLSHQKFRIEPLRGIYGVQKVMLRIYDSGYEDGLSAEILDGKSMELVLTITIANPLDDVEDVLQSKDMVYGVTRTIFAKDLIGEDNARGYEISSIEEIDTRYLNIVSPDQDPSGEWRIYAAMESVSTQVKVTFSIGDVNVERTLPIRVVANNKPQFKNGVSSYRYTLSQLNDNKEIKIRPTDWFEDTDLEDTMTFITPVKSSQTVKVDAHYAVDTAEDGGQPYIILKFNRRGESTITVNLTDLSGRSYSYDVTVECTDAPELSWWDDTIAWYETNTMWFWIIVGGAVLLIILLIVIIVVVHKKRKMRREIEALLESETELEQEMLRLSSGAAYQSFGYLPPTQQGMVNPGMMLGGGAGAPQPNSLQLNAGTGTPPPPQQAPTVNNIPNSAPNAARPQTPPVSNDGFDPNDF